MAGYTRAAVLWLSWCGTVSAATLVVSNTNDSGVGSLRDAIVQNASLGGSNTITFADGVSGTVLLTHELLVSNNVVISGPGAKVLAINGTGTNSVFHFTNVTAAVSGLTITNGGWKVSIHSGGGINTEYSTLTVSNCWICGNGAQGGGGLANQYGPVTIVGCTFSGNYCYGEGSSGGAILNYGCLCKPTTSLLVIASTFYDNRAVYGSAICNGVTDFVYGTSTSVDALLWGCTLNSTNARDPGMVVNGGDYAHIYLESTILNVPTNGVTLHGTNIVSYGYNLSSDGGGKFLSWPTDKTNTDALLGPLRDNGGQTPTMALLPGSPAIDQGRNILTTTDQRGAPRFYDFQSVSNANDGSDIGAYELTPPSINVTQTNSNVVVSWPTLGNGFRLQSATECPSMNWTAFGGMPAVIGSQFYVTNTLSNPNTFFRLVYP